MKIILAAIGGFLAGVIVCLLAAYCIILSGVVPARQDEPSSQFETWAAHQSLRATINRETASLKSPLPADEPNLAAGAKVYAGNCSGCHGAPLSPTPAFGNGYSPAAPFFASGDTVTDDPEGKIFWKVEHGVRFTGMPSFSKLLTENEIWQVTLFLKNMDKLPKSVNDTWKSMKQ